MTKDLRANGRGIASLVDDPHISFEGTFKDNKLHGLGKCLYRRIIRVLFIFTVKRIDTETGLTMIREYKDGVAFGKVTSYSRK